MKNLDLNAMGVVEMDAKDIKTTDGGFLRILFHLLMNSRTAGDGSDLSPGEGGTWDGGGSLGGDGLTPVDTGGNGCACDNV